MSLVRVQSPAAPADRATGHREPLPSADLGGLPLHKGLADAGPKGIACARPDLNRDAPRGAPAPRASASTWFRHERGRAATRGRTGPSAVRRRSRKPCAAAELAILASNQETPRPERGGSAEFP